MICLQKQILFISDLHYKGLNFCGLAVCHRLWIIGGRRVGWLRAPPKEFMGAA
jgi:hypothetical protein